LQGSVNIGIELKSIQELITSAWNKRLQSDQLPKMRKSFDVKWLLIYGEADCDRDNYLVIKSKYDNSWRRLTGTGDTFLASKENRHLNERAISYYFYLSLVNELQQCKFCWHMTRSKRTAAVFIAGLYWWWQQAAHSHKLLKALYQPSNMSDIPDNLLMPAKDLSPQRELMARLAVQMPGLGTNRAIGAAKHFDSSQSMFAGDPNQWSGMNFASGYGQSSMSIDAAEALCKVIRAKARD
jgi:hypothetical protein